MVISKSRRWLQQVKRSIRSEAKFDRWLAKAEKNDRRRRERDILRALQKMAAFVVLFAALAGAESLPGFMQFVHPVHHHAVKGTNDPRWEHKEPKHGKRVPKQVPIPNGIEKVEQCPVDAACNVSAPLEWQPRVE